jgi:hypothetical protein
VSASASHHPPSLADLRRTALVFNGFTNVDATWSRLIDDTSPGIDLALPAHRVLLLRWLNSWGCRIRYPRPGEPAPFDSGVAAWWTTWHAALPSTSIDLLSDDEIDMVADAYQALASVEVTDGRSRRTLGPTAAAKALYALRPRAVMPWDAAIAAHFHDTRDGVSFGRHLRMGREWARAVITESGVDVDEVPDVVGRPAIPLAKILDEYLYVTITVRGTSDRAQGMQSGHSGGRSKAGVDAAARV